MAVVEARKVSKSYIAGDVEVRAVREASFVLEAASFVCFVGPSGSGKSTLLNMIGCLDSPTAGSLHVLGTDVASLDRRAAARFRGSNIGFIFQDFNLIPVLSAYENVEYPLVMVQKVPAPERAKRVRELLDAVGMGNQAAKRPDQLSGGQKQRVAIARALVTEPAFVLADEPTGNLDAETGAAVIDLLLDLHRESGATLVLVTHDLDLAARCSRVVRMAGGRIASDTRADER